MPAAAEITQTRRGWPSKRGSRLSGASFYICCFNHRAHGVRTRHGQRPSPVSSPPPCEHHVLALPNIDLFRAALTDAMQRSRAGEVIDSLMPLMLGKQSTRFALTVTTCNFWHGERPDTLVAPVSRTKHIAVNSGRGRRPAGARHIGRLCAVAD